MAVSLRLTCDSINLISSPAVLTDDSISTKPVNDEVECLSSFSRCPHFHHHSTGIPETLHLLLTLTKNTYEAVHACGLSNAMDFAHTNVTMCSTERELYTLGT
jgi:hypothetical protein